ncbi:hypothetical protein [Nodosilinea nodulosa]|uniref:hypothetical protein n=1 Tax=Nodosilinea nodulosa TaxID=416001 RepID=UPI0012D7F414|nr:hypothetical protein [Nodosilinea nodulosa]
MATQIPSLSAPPGYRPQADDTGSETDLLCFHLLSQRTPTERVTMAATMMQSARKLSLHCLSRQFAHLSPQAFARKLAEAWLQEDCPPDYIPTGSEMTWIQDSTELAAQLHRIFAVVGVPYYVTGGTAAITYGEPRTTRDLDVVISVPRDALTPLVTALEAAGFYVPGVDDAMTGRMRTLQVTQVATISRADLVLADDNEYERLKFQRRRLIPWPDGSEVYLVSPEDVVVNKLRWGQQSQSDKQWRDVLGVLKTQQEQLDYEYMHRWAAEFDLSGGLEQATLEAGVRAIADQQWATAIYPAINRAFELAQARNRTTQPRPGLDIADGNRYRLTRDSAAQTLTVVAKTDDREIARYDWQGTVLTTSPSLQDRQQWRAIAQRV